MNKKFKRTSLLLLPLTAMAVSVPLMITSCASENNVIENQVDKVFFDPTKAKTQSSKETTTKLYLDPNVNSHAQEEAKKTFKDYLSAETLQTEFDKVLTKFYQAYEFESETAAKPPKKEGSTVETEADIKSIKVKSFDKDKLEAKLDVSYEVETEVESRDNEKIEIQEKTLTITPKFATKTEISQLTDFLTKGPEEQGSGNHQIDLEDIKELYVGDADDNEKSIFEVVNAFTEENARYGGLLGYEVDLKSLEYTPKTGTTKAAAQTPAITKFFAPSYGVKKFFVPQMENYKLPKGLDLTLSYEKIRTKTEAELITTEASKPSTSVDTNTGTGENTGQTPDNKGKTTLLSILKDDSDANKKLYEQLVTSVSIEQSKADTNMLDVQITLKSEDEEVSMPMVLVIGIQKSWLKQTPASTL